MFSTSSALMNRRQLIDASRKAGANSISRVYQQKGAPAGGPPTFGLLTAKEPNQTMARKREVWYQDDSSHHPTPASVAFANAPGPLDFSIRLTGPQSRRRSRTGATQSIAEKFADAWETVPLVRGAIGWSGSGQCVDGIPAPG